MKTKFLVLLLTGLFLLSSDCPLKAAATDSSALKSQAASKAEWDKLVTDAKKEGTVVIYAGPIGAARTAINHAFPPK